MMHLSVSAVKTDIIVWASFFPSRARGKTKQNQARNVACMSGKIHRQKQL